MSQAVSTTTTLRRAQHPHTAVPLDWFPPAEAAECIAARMHTAAASLLGNVLAGEFGPLDTDPAIRLRLLALNLAAWSAQLVPERRPAPRRTVGRRVRVTVAQVTP